MTEYLRAEKTTSAAIACHPDMELLCAKVIGLMIPGLRFDGDGMGAGGYGRTRGDAGRALALFPAFGTAPVPDP